MTDANKDKEIPPGTVTSENETPNTDLASSDTPLKKEYGGPKGLEPTRYGEWEKAGRCIDF